MTIRHFCERSRFGAEYAESNRRNQLRHITVKGQVLTPRPICIRPVISIAAENAASVPRDHLQVMLPGKSSSHVLDDVTWS